MLRADVTRRAPPPDAYSVGLRARAHTIVWLTRPQLRCEARVRAFAVPAPAPQPCPAARRTSASPREPTRHGHAARLHRTPELQCPREGHPTLFQRLRPPPRNRPQKWVSRIWGSAPRGGGSPPQGPSRPRPRRRVAGPPKWRRRLERAQGRSRERAATANDTPAGARPALRPSSGTVSWSSRTPATPTTPFTS